MRVSALPILRKIGHLPLLQSIPPYLELCADPAAFELMMKQPRFSDPTIVSDRLEYSQYYMFFMYYVLMQGSIIIYIFPPFSLLCW